MNEMSWSLTHDRKEWYSLSDEGRAKGAVKIGHGLLRWK